MKKYWIDILMVAVLVAFPVMAHAQQTATKTLTITVVSPLSISTSSLPAGAVGTAYTATLQAAGGTSPYTWAVTTGTLPAGLTLAGSTGVISGTPTAAGTSTLTFTVTDSSKTTASLKVSFRLHAELRPLKR